MNVQHSFADLVPVFYRLRDADAQAADGLLRALLEALDSGAQRLREELEDRYDDLFVETCGPEELLHFMELLGVRELPGRRTPRALVAKVLAFRRRKGTISALEDLARSATGWTAKATEQFPLLVVTTSLTHPRPGYMASASLHEPVATAGTTQPFDPRPTTPDLRSVESRSGRRNLPNVAVDLWRLDPVAERDRAPFPVDDRRFRFHPLGLDQPLFSNGNPEPVLEHRLTRSDVSDPLRMREAELAWEDLYGDGTSFAVYDADGIVDRSETIVCDLSDVGAGWNASPATPRLAIDPTRGRLAFTTPPPGPVLVSYTRALPLPLGGGGYDRALAEGSDELVVGVAADGSADATTVQDAALLALQAGPAGVVEVRDSQRYAVPAAIAVGQGKRLAIRAADGQWPVLTNGLQLDCAGDARVTLDGLLVSGGPVTVTGAPMRISIEHCTLVPGHEVEPDGSPTKPAELSLMLRLDADADVDVRLEHCVSGSIQAPSSQARLTVSDSIVCGQHLPGAGRQAGICVGAAAGGDMSDPLVRHQLRLHLGLGLEVDVGFQGGSVDLAAVASDLERGIRRTAGADLPDSVDEFGADLGGVTVSAHDGRLVVVGPGLDEIRFEDAGSDTTATDLGLTGDALSVVGVVGHAVSDPPSLDAGSLSLSGRLLDATGMPTDFAAGLASVPGSLVDAATQVAATASAALGGPGVLALARGDRVVVAPLRDRGVLAFGAGPAAYGLGLAVPAPALSAAGGRAFGGPSLTTKRSTWLGDVLTRVVEASDCIVTGALVASHRQRGCVRYSWLGRGSSTPRRFRTLAADAGAAPPSFVTTRFGSPALAQLRAGCPATIATGAEDGAEMGAFHDVQQPERLAAMGSLLDEYLRFTAHAGVFLES